LAVIKLRVIPRASREKIEIETDGTFRVYLGAPPVAGEANKALIRLFSRQLRIPQNRIALLKGNRSRDKLMEVVGMDLYELKETLKNP
jgi:uncharacterized protein (TIGR00251 family)